MSSVLSPGPRRQNRWVLGAIGAAAALTLLGRALGLLSQTLVASEFGAGTELDAFFIAVLLPGLLVAPLEGAIEAVIAPKVADAEAQRAGGSVGITRLVVRRGLIAGIVLGTLATAASPVLVRASAPSAGDERLDLALSLALLTYPAIAARVITASCCGVLLGRGRLRSPIVVQAVNPAAIVVVLVAGDATPHALAAAAATGWVIEAAILLVLVLRLVQSHPTATTATLPGLRAFGAIIFSYVLVQISPAIDQVFASSFDEGRLTTFIIAVRLYEVAASLLILPTVRLAQNDLGSSVRDNRQFVAVFRRSLRRSGAAGVLSAVGLAVAGPVVVTFAFQRGEFGGDDGSATTAVVLVLAIALVPSGFGYVLSRTLIILERRRQLLGVMAVQITLNVVLNVALVRHGGPGLAASTVVTYIVGDVLMYRALPSWVSSPDPAIVPELELEDRPERPSGAATSGIESADE